MAASSSSSSRKQIDTFQDFVDDPDERTFQGGLVGAEEGLIVDGVKPFACVFFKNSYFIFIAQDAPLQVEYISVPGESVEDRTRNVVLGKPSRLDGLIQVNPEQGLYYTTDLNLINERIDPSVSGDNLKFKKSTLNGPSSLASDDSIAYLMMLAYQLLLRIQNYMNQTKHNHLIFSLENDDKISLRLMLLVPQPLSLRRHASTLLNTLNRFFFIPYYDRAKSRLVFFQKHVDLLIIDSMNHLSDGRGRYIENAAKKAGTDSIDTMTDVKLYLSPLIRSIGERRAIFLALEIKEKKKPWPFMEFIQALLTRNTVMPNIKFDPVSSWNFNGNNISEQSDKILSRIIAALYY